jgi:metal-responsive CopG/Arc/MetJ family transcriptional regulator
MSNSSSRNNNSTKSLTVRIPIELHDIIDKVVHNYDSKSELVILAISEYLEHAQTYLK